MTVAEDADTGWWWETTPVGERISLGFVKIDRVGSTAEWDRFPDDVVVKRRARYTGSLVNLSRRVDAAQPLHFQGDGVMLFLTDGDEVAAVRAFQAARELWERMLVDLSFPVRIAVHAATVSWTGDTGHLADPAIDLCGHLEHAAPTDSIAVTERVYLALPEKLRRELGPLGLTRRDRTPAYVYPASAASQRDDDAFLVDDDLELWAAFRGYAMSGEVRQLRYVGIRLQRKEPPTLDVRDVFVPLQVTSRLRALPNFEALRKAVTEKEDEIPWGQLFQTPEEEVEPFRDAFVRHRSLVVLGDPGSGKTTLLRWLAVVAAAGPDALSRELGVEARWLPLPISIGRLAEVRRGQDGVGSVVEALARYFYDRNVGDEGRLAAFLERQLEDGCCLVLLDGLDETRSEERAELVGWLESFASRYDKNRFVVTSRIVGYPGISLPDAGKVVTHPFDDAQVARYVHVFHRAYRRWETGVDDETAADQEARQLLEAFASSSQLKSLARNPFLISALALIHRAEGRMPRHRVQVYEMFARALCETWGSVRRLVAGKVDPDMLYEEEALPILGLLALRMHEDWPDGVAPEEFVVDTLAEGLRERRSMDDGEARRAAQGFLRRAGEEVQILVERGPGLWGFLHLTFQEFFAVARLHAMEEFDEVAFKRFFDPRWTEVLKLGLSYYHLVQKRPRAVELFLRKALTQRIHGREAWVTDVLHKEVYRTLEFSADVVDALSAGLATEILAKIIERMIRTPVLPLSKASMELFSELLATFTSSFEEFVGHLGRVSLFDLREAFVAAESRSKEIDQRIVSMSSLGRLEVGTLLADTESEDFVKSQAAFLQLWAITERILVAESKPS